MEKEIITIEYNDHPNYRWYYNFEGNKYIPCGRLPNIKTTTVIIEK